MQPVSDLAQKNTLIQIKKPRVQTARLGRPTNIFALQTSQAQKQDRSYYKNLYQFDADQELAEYSLPMLGQPCRVKPHSARSGRPPLKTQRSQSSRIRQLDNAMDFQAPPPRETVPQFKEDEYDEEEEIVEDQSDALHYAGFEKIINTEGQTNNQTTELRKANFIRKNTASWHMVQAIETGDQAISFFAKHGTNMPIKFLNCNRKPVPPAGYRPYDLIVIEDEKKLEKEYFTISAQGVVQVQNEKRRRIAKVKQNTTPTEFLTLSDWMQQSTMFNVLTSMKFFKHYLINKVFGLWKGNVRYRTYTKTRQNLAKALIQARPDFQNTYLDINKILYDMQVKTTYFVCRSQKNYEIEDFNTDQLKHRIDTKAHYNDKVEDIINNQLQKLVVKVSNSRAISDQDDLENTKIGQAIKNKSMVLQKMEDALKNRVLKLAFQNYNSLGTFIRLIDYMVVETQVRINQEASELIVQEMDREDRKYGLQTIIGFDNIEDGLNYTPTVSELKQHIEKLLNDMSSVTEEVQRVISHNDFHQFIHGLITESGPRFRTIIEQSVKYRQLREAIIDRLNADFTWIEEKTKVFKTCRDINEFDQTFNFEQQFKEQNLDLESVKEMFEKLAKWDSNINKITNEYKRGLFCASGRKLRDKLQNRIKKEQDNLRHHLFEMATQTDREITRGLSQMKEQLTKPIVNLISYVEYVNRLLSAKSQFSRMSDQKRKFEEMKAVLTKFRVKDENAYSNSGKISQLQAKIDYIGEEIISVEAVIKKAEETAAQNKETYVEQLNQHIQQEQEKLVDLIEKIESESLMNKQTPHKDALQELKKLEQRFEQSLEKVDQYRSYEQTLSVAQAQIPQIDQFKSKFKRRLTIWSNWDTFLTQQKQWYNCNFRELDAEQVVKAISKLSKENIEIKLRMAKEDKDEVLEELTRDVKDIEQHKGLIQALGSKAMLNRHWIKVYQVLGAQSPNFETGITLQSLIEDCAAMDHIEEIEDISGAAQGELQIENTLKIVKDRWEEINFVVISYRDSKDRFVITEVDDLVTQLEDDTMTVSTMMGSKFVQAIRESVEEMERKLVYLADVIDEWLKFQRQWMYLENIFNAEDIIKQLPAEAKLFQQVDKQWKEHMGRAKKSPKALDFASDYDIGVNLKKFQDNNRKFDEIQKCLEEYLSTKRAAFPRFYFLSNDEMLEILSQTRNAHAVQPHLIKCFDSMKKILFTKEEGSKTIVGMFSPENEYVEWSGIVKAEGGVEFWLTKIEKMMTTSLYDKTKNAFYTYPENGIERSHWLFHTAAQPILTIDMVMWTKGCEEAIYEIMKGKNAQALKEFVDFSDKQLKNMIKLVRGKLENLQRIAMGALIVLDVHAIEVVRNMIHARVENINDFPWTSQLRYYWEPLTDKDGEPYSGDDTTHDVFAKQTITRFRYGYEYLGNGPRLVITPLTDQCYMTLTGALHLNFGGNPAGPAGTGKTETTKDLAKALAVQCVVFNCSDGLNIDMMSRFFTGLSSGGAWSCFDEFNRIDIEVLSVIAQQILTIQSAVKARLPRFIFEGKEIPLNLRFGVFITMNPGYAGRTELPDNLKALFRPMAMMIPDYRLIAEISLYSEGFETAKDLSKKMVKLYSLSSEQLSKQDHYDFGMRAVKSVLVMAGKLRKKDDTVPEDILLIRAMRDSNVPKFLEQDLPLFRGIIKDLFPSVIVPFIDYGKLQKQIEAELRKINYQTKPEFITKIIQLLETMTVRHGNMLVGTTGTGKTTVAKILGEALFSLNKAGEDDSWYKPVKIQSLNPKSVTMGELFGEVNKLTNEWTEGIVSNLVKEAVNALEGKEADWKRWIIFDGPVDALWIENMNTVLDDNKMLCLNNGQRIKMPETCTMMFEVNDLRVASPATVSRCGMVYLEPEHLGWKVLLQTWSEKMVEQIPEPYLEMIVNTLFPVLEQLLTIIKKSCKQTIQSQDCNLVSSCLNLTYTFLGKDKINLENKEKVPAPERTVMTYLSFSVIWSLGANLHDSSRSLFSDKFKTCIRQYFPEFPDGDVYEYGIDGASHVLQSWQEQIPSFQYNPKANFFDILVPTNDTVKYKFLFLTLMYNGYNTLLSGETGVGKSVIAKDFLMTSNEQLDPAFVNFSGKTNSKNLQDAFEGNLEQKRKNLLAPKVLGTRKIFLIDDINMPQLETYGAQPPCELLRQTIDQGGFYDVKKLIFKNVKDTKFIAACAPPGGGRNVVTPRLFRHFNMIWVPDLSQASMKTIFTAILKGNLELKPGGGLAVFAEYVVKSAVDIYQKVISDFLPTPTKCHYTFNLRDLSKIIQGMLMCRFEDIPDKEYLVFLYMSETYRVFRDRLIDEKDRERFNIMSHESMELFLTMDWELSYFCNTLFGDFETNEKKYIKLSSSNDLIPRLDELLNLYNTDSNNQAMNLVFFDDCIQHLSRISRILRQQRGNAMLVGVGGSGRSSMARLASSINAMSTFSIEITKSYRQKEWYEDIKRMLRKCGLEEETVQFLFSDTQIVTESFLEDINNLLNSGEIPNLFPPDEKINICDELSERARSVGQGNNRDQIYAYFVAQCRERLHIVLAFSPVGEQFRNRCRQFPSIINCCTIDWYNAWPSEALYSVAFRQYKENEVKLGVQDSLQVLSHASVFIHQSVKDASEQFYAELRRRNYTTPTSYLDLIKTYIEMLSKQKIIVPSKMTRYQNGLSRLAETNVMVDDLKKKLIQLMPVIDEKTKATQELVVDLEVQTEDAAQIEKTTAVEEAAAKKIFNQVMEIKNECQKVLSEAMPTLKRALAALDTLNKGDIVEMKNYGQPPEDLILVMDAVCVLLDKKTGWAEAKSVMNNPTQFIESLQNYDKDKIPVRIMKKLKKYVDDPKFVPDLIAKKSQAGKSICMWVLAMDQYAAVKKVVEPKEAKLAEAEKELEVAQTDLKGKQQKLQAVRNKIYQLNLGYQNSLKVLEDLNTQKETTELQLGRAEKLVNGLHEESIRWGIAIQDLEKQLVNLTGNILLAAGYISYVGTFTQLFRNKLLKEWMQHLVVNGIPFSHDFSVEKQLGDPVLIRDWLIKGLPADSLSVSNGIICTSSKRWPLIIDPQSQGNKWQKNMNKTNNHKVIKLSNPKFLNIIDTSIRMGFPVLLENVEEKLDPSLEPILQKNIVKVQGQWSIKLGDGFIPYNNDFSFTITTKLANPHYLPEICIKVTLINFTVTPEGLEDQLLVEVVRSERPELEQQKDQLILQLSDFKRQLKELEDKILKLVAEASDDILNDEELIQTLDQSKETSIAINERMVEAEVTAKDIDENRENYRMVARRGSVLYFVIADLANIDPMYQYSLEFFTKLFVMRLEKSEKSPSLQIRLQILTSDITRAFYYSICRGLFEKDKLLYSFLNATSILRRDGMIDADEWNFFLRGSLTDYSKVQQNVDYIDQTVFKSICGLEDSHVNFRGLIKSFSEQADRVAWKEIVNSNEPQNVTLPSIYEDRLSAFQKCMLLKALRPSKLMFAVKNFVKVELGPKFIESPPFDIEGCLADSSNVTPIIFVLSPGADPIAYLNALAEKRGMKEKNHGISLGQGQGVKAEKLIKEAQATGCWVCLQNCHLSASWMPELEKIQETQDGGLIHADYRLWLTSAPSSAFPVPVLQGGLKITNEPPKGLKANMTRSLTDIGEERYEGCSKNREYKKLVFALAYFHAAILERRKYGAIGWNIPYEWMNSDFNTSELNLRMYLDEQPEVPYTALNYLIAQVNYGGRVTDDKDIRCIKAMLKNLFRSEIMQDGYKLSKLDTYYAPPVGSFSDALAYVSQLPLDEDPEVFGLHTNANIAFELKTMNYFMDTVLIMQPRTSGGKAIKAPEDIVTELAILYRNELPVNLIIEKAHPLTFAETEPGVENSLGVFVRQEIHRFNQLLNVIRISLVQLEKAIQGTVVMSIELEKMFQKFIDGRVPENWINVGYPCLKPLASWFKDLVKRIEFISGWLYNGPPCTYWISSFFFPQGFITATMQTYARKNAVAIDTLSFRTNVMPNYAKEIRERPEIGVYIHGLFMQGAKWDPIKKRVDDSAIGIPIIEFPVIWLEPILEEELKLDKQFSCPLYKTSIRAGELSTTGHSTNFVLYLAIPTDRDSDYWVRRGTALLCMTDD